MSKSHSREDPKITLNVRSLVSFTVLCKSRRFSQRGISPSVVSGLMCAHTTCSLAVPAHSCGYGMLVWPRPSAGPRAGG